MTQHKTTHEFLRKGFLAACLALCACGGGGGTTGAALPPSIAVQTATPTPSPNPSLQPNIGWRLTAYFTPVASFYSGTPQTTPVGTYASDFLAAVRAEGSGKVSADSYINYSQSNGYVLDSLPRDSQGNALIPYRSAAADTSIPFGTEFKVLGCGADTSTGTGIASSVCANYQWQSAWVVTDHFNAASVGSHLDLYVGEQTSAIFANNSNIVDSSGANVALGSLVGQPPWKPTASDTFQIIFNSALDTSAPASVYEIDGEGASAGDVAILHGLQRHAVCYIDGGSWESYRSDASAFPTQLLGMAYPGFPNERWLDIRRIDLLGPIMQRRLDTCASKGFDAVHPDNMAGYENATGFPLSAADQIIYNAWFASLAHERHLAIALANDNDQVAQLEPIHDFAMAESCSAQGCSALAPFHANGKGVFVIEYTNATSAATFTGAYCPQAKSEGFDVILKHPSADSWIQTCP